MVGDGGFLMNGAQELGTAVANGIDITIIILNDNAYGMIKWKQACRLITPVVQARNIEDNNLGLVRSVLFLARPCLFVGWKLPNRPMN